jgi:hypothetical protein
MKKYDTICQDWKNIMHYRNIIDIQNLGLITMAWISAMLVPFETLLIAYAFIGPAHYLTQISWMHDRNYFSKKKYDSIPIILLTILAFILTSGFYIPIMMALLSYAISVAVFEDWKKRFFSIFVIILTLIYLEIIFQGSGIYIFIPTLIHVGIFTSIFMFSGALKSKSFWGFFNVLILYVGATLMLFLPVETYELSSYTDKNFYNLSDITTNFIQFFDYKGSEENLFKAARFAAFLYFYHYLNWFSKTKIIEWHKTSKERIKAISLTYIICIAAYFYDYSLGYKLLLFLSFLHVTLEFPLNAISIQSIFKHFSIRKKSA